MTSLTVLDAYDLLSSTAAVLDRLARAQEELRKHPGLERERGWLAQATELAESVCRAPEELLKRAARLPELASVREDRAEALQGEWVDALERLHGGITFHAGSRAPIMEALFPHVKLPTLRRAKREVVEKYGADFERRLASSYVKRMFGQESFAFAAPVVEQVQSAFRRWREVFSADPLPTEEAQRLGQSLLEAAAALELPLRQVRLLAEAALAPLPEAFDALGFAQKPRRRSAKPAPVAEVEADPAAADEQSDPAPEPEADVPPPANRKPGKRARKEPEAVEAASTPAATEAPAEASDAPRPRKRRPKGEQAGTSANGVHDPTPSA